MFGVVKWYNPTKGFGFIAPEGSGKDVFVHASSLQKAGIRELAEGQRVEFDKEPGRKGEQATNLHLA